MKDQLSSGASCMAIIDRALSMDQAGRDVIHLEKGELEFNTPDEIKERAISAIRSNCTFYSQSGGLPELREAICDYYCRTYHVSLQPSQVLVNSGSSPALLLLFHTILLAGDQVILSNPCYPAYPKLVEASGAKPVFVETKRQGFLYTAAEVKTKISELTRAIVINFPSNPVGLAADAMQLAAFAELGPFIVSDEVCLGLVFDDVPQHSILEFTDHAAVTNSFSKTFAMAGWRLGYAIVPEGLVDRASELQQHLFPSANTFVQVAAVVALENSDRIIKEARDELRRRRECLLRGLGQLGFEVPRPPQGAFYVFARLPGYLRNSVTFAKELLEHYCVAVTPGIDFGTEGEGFVRFSFAASCQRIDEAIDRIGSYLSHESQGV